MPSPQRPLLAQLDRAPGFEPGGWGFKSLGAGHPNGSEAVIEWNSMGGGGWPSQAASPFAVDDATTMARSLREIQLPNNELVAVVPLWRMRESRLVSLWTRVRAECGRRKRASATLDYRTSSSTCFHSILVRHARSGSRDQLDGNCLQILSSTRLRETWAFASACVIALPLDASTAC